jgi:ABC-2 type transport system permease protein
MNRLLRTELLKQRSLRTFLVGIAAAPAVGALVTVAVLEAAGEDGNDPLGPNSLVQVIGAPASVLTAIALVLGILGMAGEYRHQTITTTFLASPRRRDVLAAKMVAHGMTGAAMATMAMVVSVAIAIGWLQWSSTSVHADAGAARVALGLIASTGLYGALGVSLGAVFRNQTAATTVALVWLLAIEGLLGDIFRTSWTRWLPAAAARAMVHSGPVHDGLSASTGALVFAVYVVAFAAAGVCLTLKRDIN